jgi:pimeloyl-ACP methyl ester carboxylesterase
VNSPIRTYYLRNNSAAPAILVGHSLGGAAVLAAAADIPEAKAVVTIGAPADVSHVLMQFGGSLQEIRDTGEARVRAPSPYDYLSIALCACTAMTLGIYGEHKKLTLGRISVAVRHGKVAAQHCSDCGAAAEGREGRTDRFGEPFRSKRTSTPLCTTSSSRLRTNARCIARWKQPQRSSPLSTRPLSSHSGFTTYTSEVVSARSAPIASVERSPTGTNWVWPQPSV